MQDTEPVDGDDVDHIFISFADSCMIFSGYIAYVLVCANMEAVVAFCNTSKARLVGGNSNTSYGSIGEAVVSQNLNVPDYPFVMEKQNLSSEPVSNWASVSLYLPKEDKREEQAEGEQTQTGRVPVRSSSRSGSFLATSFRTSVAYTRSSILVDLFKHSEAPSKMHDLYYIEYNEVST
jgi:hypothetical protein